MILCPKYDSLVEAIEACQNGQPQTIIPTSGDEQVPDDGIVIVSGWNAEWLGIACLSAGRILEIRPITIVS